MRHLLSGFIAFSGLVSKAAMLFALQVELAAKLPLITENQSGRILEFNELVAKTSACEVLFLGENHEDDSGHRFQLQVIEALLQQKQALVISTEQFERDVQGALDDYLLDRITEEQFLAVGRPWKNYQQHYRPMIELAKQNKIPVLAANLPRHLASRISANELLQPHEMVFAARMTSAPEDRYWSNFEQTMKGHMGADGAEKMRAFYRAQCAKDDAMAEAITDFFALSRHRQVMVVHLCGHFHSDYGLGTVARVTQRNPLLRSAIVTMEPLPENGQPKPADTAERAHFTFWTIPNPTPAQDGTAASANGEKK